MGTRSAESCGAALCWAQPSSLTSSLVAAPRSIVVGEGTSPAQSGRRNMDNVFDRLSPEAGRALFFARGAVSKHGGHELAAEHVLLGILAVAPATIQRFANAEWTPQRLEQTLIQGVQSVDKVPESVDIGFSVGTQQVLARAAEAARRKGSMTIDLQHLLLGLVDDHGAAGELLRRAEVTAAKINESLR